MCCRFSVGSPHRSQTNACTLIHVDTLMLTTTEHLLCWIHLAPEQVRVVAGVVATDAQLTDVTQPEIRNLHEHERKATENKWRSLFLKACYSCEICRLDHILSDFSFVVFKFSSIIAAFRALRCWHGWAFSNIICKNNFRKNESVSEKSEYTTGRCRKSWFSFTPQGSHTVCGFSLLVSNAAQSRCGLRQLNTAFLRNRQGPCLSFHFHQQNSQWLTDTLASSSNAQKANFTGVVAGAAAGC